MVRIRLNESDDAKEQALQLKNLVKRHNAYEFFRYKCIKHLQGFKYENSFNIETQYFKHADDDERKRRVRLYLEATKSMNDYASQARNAVSGEPKKVLIIFDTILSRKASRYFVAGDQERKNILDELNNRGAVCFFGDDTTENSVYKAYNKAIEFLQNSENLIRPVR